MNKQNQKSGQVAIMLMLILLMLTIITTAAVAIGFSTSRDTTTYTIGEEALAVAESGAENAILHILRDPNYIGEPNLPIGAGNATITVTGSGTKTIISKGTVGSLVRQIQVQAGLSGGQLTVQSWQEI